MIGRLKEGWQDECARWQRRDLSARRYVYVWADGVYLQARMEPTAECMLVVIGATPEGKKELVGFQTGVRESVQSWRELLVDLMARGLATAPEIAVGDGAMGFWRALEEVFPSTRHQRCWAHKAANVLNAVPKSVQPGMRADLREVRDAPDRAQAEAAIAVFVKKYGAKYPKAVERLVKDRDALLAFFDFPAEHWDHLRTANPIEERVRHRPPSDRPNQGSAVADHRPADGVQARHGRLEDLAAPEGREPLADAPRRRHLHRRRRHRGARSPRRLIGRVTQNQP